MARIVGFKLGGGAVKDPSALEQSIGALESRQYNGAKRHFGVVSAPRGVTPLLTQAVQARQNGNSGEEQVRQIVEIFSTFPQAEGMDIKEQIDSALQGDMSFAGYRDSVVGLGEDIHGRIVADYMGAKYVSPRDLFKLTGNFSDARFTRDSPEMAVAVLEDLLENTLVITGGFSGFNEEGQMMTLGLGGSDETAAVLLKWIELHSKHTVEVYENLTDKPGVFTADPITLSSAKQRNEIIYTELGDLADRGGGKIFFHRGLLPVQEAHIPVVIRGWKTEDYDNPGTIVSDSRSGGPIAGMTFEGGYRIIEIEKPGMRDENGIYAKIGAVLNQYGVGIETDVSAGDKFKPVVKAANIEDALVRNRLQRDLLEALNYDGARNATVNFKQEVGYLLISGKGIDQALHLKTYNLLNKRGIEVFANDVEPGRISAFVVESSNGSVLKVVHDTYFPGTQKTV